MGVGVRPAYSVNPTSSEHGASIGGLASTRNVVTSLSKHTLEASVSLYDVDSPLLRFFVWSRSRKETSAPFRLRSASVTSISTLPMFSIV